MTDNRTLRWFLFAYLALVFVFIFAPIFFSVVFSFNSDRFPTIPLGNFTLKWYQTVWNDPDVWEAARTSLTVSLSTATIATALGFATAYTFGMRGMSQVPNQSVHSMLSCYTFDVCVPFIKGTWKAIRSAKDAALTGVDLMHQGERAVFSLCRPPGHHASRDMAGGYCYLNNAAIAAQAYLNKGAKRVAILDIDYHHGNGTQAVFYDRADVFFASLHCRPEEEYPFLMGYAAEVGKGAGKGYNLNLPMPRAALAS